MVGRLLRLGAAAIIAVAIASSPVCADSPRLADARRAIDDVRYDEAQRLLVQALGDGGNSPAAVIEIYELSAKTAVVLGQAELAEQYYRRLLALQPEFKLADDVAPKLREPLVAAQAFMAAHGKLEVQVIRRDATVIDVAVIADPVTMAVSAAFVVAGVPGERVALTAGRAALHPPPAFDDIVVLDDHGNELVVVAPGDIATPPPVARPVVVPPRHVPLLRRWMTWAIPTVVVAGVGIGFAIDASRADDRLRKILDDSPHHTFGDSETERRRRDRSAVIADISLGVAAGFAVVTTLIVLTRPGARPTVVPTVGTDHVGVALVGNLP